MTIKMNVAVALATVSAQICAKSEVMTERDSYLAASNDTMAALGLTDRDLLCVDLDSVLNYGEGGAV